MQPPSSTDTALCPQRPTPIVVVHGVGDQRPGDSARELAIAYARCLATTQGPATVTGGQTIVSHNAKQGSGEQFTSQVYTVTGFGSAVPIAVFYDFCWAHLSSPTTSEASRLWSLGLLPLRIAALGKAALHPSVSNAMATIIKVLFVATCWLIYLRTFTFVFLETVPLIYSNDALLCIDLLIAFLMLLFAVGGVATVLAGKLRWACFETAAYSLTVVVLAWGLIPAVIKSLTGSKPSSDHGAYWLRRLDWPLVDGSGLHFTSDWIYGFNTLSGMSFYVALLAFLLTILSCTVLFGRSYYQAQQSPKSAVSSLSRIEYGLVQAMRGISLIVIVASPLVMLYELISLTVFRWTPITGYLPEDSEITLAAAWFGGSGIAAIGIVIAFFWYNEALRPAANTVLEFSTDVIRYFRTGESGGGLAALTESGLSDLLGTIEAIHGRPAVVVAHSLGSLIATECISNGGSVRAVLTMGCPIMRVNRRYPELVEKWLIGIAGMSGGIEWSNYFCASDYVGRDIGSVVEMASDELIGAGGHTGYFQSPLIAKRLHEAIGASR